MYIKGTIFVFLSVALSACGEKEQKTVEQYSTVRSIDLTHSDFRQSVTLTGVIAANVDAALSFRVSGTITQWNVDVGDHIANGQVLAELDSRQQSADVEAAQASVQSALSGVQQASSEFERRKTLLAKGSTSQALYDQAETELEVAKGSLENAEAQLGRAKDTLSYTELRSDRDGIVTARNAELGQVVKAAQAIFNVASDGPRDAVFYVPEYLLLSRPEGPAVEIRLVSNPAIKTVGRIREISPSLDQATATARVKLTLEATPPEMTLGAPVTGFASAPAEKRFVLPAASIANQNGKPAVWIVDPKTKTVSLRSIEVVLYESDHIVASGGIDEGETVVVAGGKLLRPGETVNVEKETLQ